MDRLELTAQIAHANSDAWRQAEGKPTYAMLEKELANLRELMQKQPRKKKIIIQKKEDLKKYLRQKNAERAYDHLTREKINQIIDNYNASEEPWPDGELTNRIDRLEKAVRLLAAKALTNDFLGRSQVVTLLDAQCEGGDLK